MRRRIMIASVHYWAHGGCIRAPDGQESLDEASKLIRATNTVPNNGPNGEPLNIRQTDTINTCHGTRSFVMHQVPGVL